MKRRYKLYIADKKNRRQELDITKVTHDELTIGIITGDESIHMTFTPAK